MKDASVKIHHWLYPLSWLYGAGVCLRNKLFDWGWLRSRSFDVPVICVGNIAVGGTGKTPHTEYLIKLLQNEGIKRGHTEPRIQTEEQRLHTGNRRKQRTENRR